VDVKEWRYGQTSSYLDKTFTVPTGYAHPQAGRPDEFSDLLGHRPAAARAAVGDFKRIPQGTKLKVAKRRNRSYRQFGFDRIGHALSLDAQPVAGRQHEFNASSSTKRWTG